jgi:hypothetical protein
MARGSLKTQRLCSIGFSRRKNSQGILATACSRCPPVVAGSAMVDGKTPVQAFTGLGDGWLPPFEWDRLSEQGKRNEERHADMIS